MPPIIAAAATTWSQSAASCATQRRILGVALDEAVARVLVV